MKWFAQLSFYWAVWVAYFLAAILRIVSSHLGNFLSYGSAIFFFLALLILWVRLGEKYGIEHE